MGQALVKETVLSFFILPGMAPKGQRLARHGATPRHVESFEDSHGDETGKCDRGLLLPPSFPSCLVHTLPGALSMLSSF